MDTLVRSQKGTEEEEAMVRRAGHEVHEFVKNRWVESEWETAWFVNPPVRYSVFRYFCISKEILFFAEASKCFRLGSYTCICEAQDR